MEIVSKVVGLPTVKRVQEIAIWQRDTDILYLDGKTENLNWGYYNLKEMEELGFVGMCPNLVGPRFRNCQAISITKDGEVVDEAEVGHLYFHR